MTEKEYNNLKKGDIVQYPNRKRSQSLAGKKFKLCRVYIGDVMGHPQKKNGDFSKSKRVLFGIMSAKLIKL